MKNLANVKKSLLMKMFRIYRHLLPLLLFTIILVLVRVAITESPRYIFLLWNVFLAILPLYFSNKAVTTTKNLMFAFWSGLWMLFLPNSFYIVTDLYHLGISTGIPQWFDLVLISSAAANGIIYSFLSLRNIELRLNGLFNTSVISLLLGLMMLLCGYGVYLGRYNRWNSWDIVCNPLSLVRDIAFHVMHPFRNVDVWGLSLVFGLWMYLLYMAFRKSFSVSRS
ncbi:MAG: DUF1361 domain-containing protein [Sphingobacteriales bacterium]|nr:MAG: DUF1361 domain-containing protein [Sphingobacteriales bacterium]